MSDTTGLRYRRLCLKLSGEALSGTSEFGVDMAVLTRLSREVKQVVEAGAQIVVVVGGGNIFRGLAGAAKGMDRATADYMGMLATVMNALAFHNALEQLSQPARVLGRHFRRRHGQSVFHHRHDGCATRH